MKAAALPRLVNAKPFLVSLRLTRAEDLQLLVGQALCPSPGLNPWARQQGQGLHSLDGSVQPAYFPKVTMVSVCRGLGQGVGQGMQHGDQSPAVLTVNSVSCPLCRASLPPPGASWPQHPVFQGAVPLGGETTH